MSISGLDWDLLEAIQDLVAAGMLEKGMPAHEAAIKVIHTGYTSLSPRQRKLYDTIVVPALKEREEELQQVQLADAD